MKTHGRQSAAKVAGLELVLDREVIPVTEQQVTQSGKSTQNPYKIKVGLALEKPEKNNHDVDEVEALILQNRNTLLTSMQKKPRTCQTVQAEAARCHLYFSNFLSGRKKRGVIYVIYAFCSRFEVSVFVSRLNSTLKSSADRRQAGRLQGRWGVGLCV